MKRKKTPLTSPNPNRAAVKQKEPYEDRQLSRLPATESSCNQRRQKYDFFFPHALENKKSLIFWRELGKKKKPTKNLKASELQ